MLYAASPPIKQSTLIKFLLHSSSDRRVALLWLNCHRAFPGDMLHAHLGKQFRIYSRSANHEEMRYEFSSERLFKTPSSPPTDVVCQRGNGYLSITQLVP